MTQARVSKSWGPRLPASISHPNAEAEREIPSGPGHAAHETEDGGHEIEGEDRALLANASYGWSQRGESGITPRVGTRSRWNRRRR
ncbi:MAG: hypothetical protein P1U85_16485 [Verrucomicrobiales bacterium]|jgi:hypothetical protein|nr:hypothetical protein [Verrucomicrobiales bacterium]